MAFDVTPTSGTSPYTFTADILNKDAFNFDYVLRFGISPASTASCPLPATATGYSPIPASILLNQGVYVRPSNVPVGSCITYKLEILDGLGEVVDMQYVSIDNIPEP